MKKATILALLTISLVGGMGRPLARVDGVRKETKIEAFDTTPVIGAKMPNAIRSADKIFPDANAAGANFDVSMIDFQQNRMVIEIKQDGDWQIRRVVAATWDYEKGKTEAEADAELGDLGTAASATWRILWDYEADGITGLYTDVEPKVGEEVLSWGGNLTDVIYYGVEYGHKNGEDWEDLWWERGKVNYRDCAGLLNFSANTMLCTEVDKAYRAVWRNYTEVETAGERVISWDEEWGAEQRQRYRDAMGKLEGLRDNLGNVAGILREARGTLAGLEVTLAKMDGMWDRERILGEIVRLNGVAAKIEADYAEINKTAFQGEIERLTRENGELTAEKARLADVLAAEKAGAADLARENEELRRKLAEKELEGGARDETTGDAEDSEDSEDSEAGTTTDFKGDSAAEDGAGSATDTGAIVEAGSVKAGDGYEANSGVLGGGSGEIADLHGKAQAETQVNSQAEIHGNLLANSVEKQKDEADVPNLGKIEKAGKMTGWMAATGVSAVGLAGLGARRKLKNGRKLG